MKTTNSLLRLSKTVEKAILKIRKTGKTVTLYAPDKISQITMLDLLDELSDEFAEVDKIKIEVRSIH